jgi:MFS family permease
MKAILFGMALAPTIAGFTAHYWSWRATQYQIFWAASLAFTLTMLLQPETSQPGTRGLDKLIEKEGRSRWVWLNPFANVALLRSPNVFFVVRVSDIILESFIEDVQSLAQGMVVITDYGESQLFCWLYSQLMLSRSSSFGSYRIHFCKYL